MGFANRTRARTGSARGGESVPEPAGLDGRWRLERLDGFLPPLGFMRKEIAGSRGRTLVGGVPFRFRVAGRELRYRVPLIGLVDVVDAGEGDTRRGQARLFGRTVGSFLMTRE
ncbi:MAG TPA: hypothetical protein VG265_14725 [Gaiellaceae bacterium]|nr:hypothetical protein [Gaiellaceae bacterium]